MSGCIICDRVSELQYECNYCSGKYCTEHRLPENHDCFAVVVHNHLNTEWFNDNTQKRVNAVSDDTLNNIANKIEQTNFSDISRSTSLNPRDMAKKAVHMLQQQTSVESNEKSYTVYEPEHTVGTSVDPNYESSPDVNPDGSIDTQPNELNKSNLSPPNKSRFTWLKLRTFVLKYGFYIVFALAISYWYFFMY